METLQGITQSSWWHNPFVQYGIRIGTALLILLIGLWLARWIAGAVRGGISRRGGDAVLADFLRNVVLIGVSVVVIVGALDRAGIPTASLLAALGAAGLAIGLALQGSLGNLASGVLLVITRPFHAGDAVEIGGQAGTVQRIDLLQTVLIGADNRVITVPNAQVMGQPIINLTVRGTRRIEMLFLVTHESDPRAALEASLAVMTAHAGVLKDPAPQAQVTRIGDTGIEFAARAWTNAADFGNVQADLLPDIRAALAQAGVKLALTGRAARADVA